MPRRGLPTSWRDRGVSQSSRGRECRDLLSSGARGGRGDGYAPAPGPLPPRPREALPAHREAGAGTGASRDGGGDVPRDGHGLLVGEGGGRTRPAPRNSLRTRLYTRVRLRANADV